METTQSLMCHVLVCQVSEAFFFFFALSIGVPMFVSWRILSGFVFSVVLK